MNEKIINYENVFQSSHFLSILKIDYKQIYLKIGLRLWLFLVTYLIWIKEIL